MTKKKKDNGNFDENDHSKSVKVVEQLSPSPPHLGFENPLLPLANTYDDDDNEEEDEYHGKREQSGDGGGRLDRVNVVQHGHEDDDDDDDGKNEDDLANGKAKQICRSAEGLPLS